jgi:hypothetical protein
MSRRALAALVLVSLGLGLSTCLWAPPLYWGEAIHGRVVDAASGLPIEGAVVVADWKLYSGGVGHGGHRSSLLVRETVTDADGRFAFPAWGPLLRPSYQALDKAPWLIVFKSGYEHQALWNERRGNGFVRRSQWHGRTIGLSKFTGSAKVRLDHLATLVLISTLQPLLLREILKERPLYFRERPAFFDHLESLLGSSSRHPS